MKRIEEIKFYGIDCWNRPIFKSTKYKNFYGSTEILFGIDATEKEVLDKVTENDLSFFGNKFQCEPMGIKCSNLKIIMD